MKIRNTMYIVLAGILSLAVLVGCGGYTDSTSEKQEETRDSAMDRAHAAVPIPHTSNFLTRETVAEFMRRTDETDKLFYVYVLASGGNYIGYYVAQGRPVNICTFLSPPDRLHDDYDWGAVRAAPGMDGVYYGGNACDSEYFFDAETDAMVEIVTRGGISMFVSDQPLELDVQRIRVGVEPKQRE